MHRINEVNILDQYNPELQFNKVKSHMKNY